MRHAWEIIFQLAEVMVPRELVFGLVRCIDNR